MRRLLGTSSSLTCVNFLLKVNFFSLGMLAAHNRAASPIDISMIDPMSASDAAIVQGCLDKPWSFDDEGAMLPPWALRHKRLNEMVGCVQGGDADPERADPRVRGYSQILTGGPHSLFEFSVSPRVIKGQAGAGADSRLTLGATVKVSYSWVAYKRDSPTQGLAPVSRAV